MSSARVALTRESAPCERAEGPPIRLSLSEAALTSLATAAGLELPWHRAARGRCAERLGGAPPEPAAPEPAPPEPAPPEPARLGRVADAGGVPEAVARALRPFGAAEVHVELDLSRRAAGGAVRARGWHRLAGERVAWLVACGGRFELGWCHVAWWQDLLTEWVAPVVEPGGTAPARELELPIDLLLASAAAVRRDRDDLLAELLHRDPGVRCGPASLPPASVARQLRLVHTAVTARLLATVAGHGPRGQRRVGLVSWLRYPDGWRVLTPLRRDAVDRVRLEPATPERLGADLARLALGVRGR